MAKTAPEEAQKNIAENQKASHDYHLLETFEAGVAMLGTEVKSIRGGANLRDSVARIEAGEVWIYNVHQRLPQSPLQRSPTDAEAELLLHRQEIRMDLKNGRVKVAVCLAKGKKAARQARYDQAARDRAGTRAAVKERR